MGSLDKSKQLRVGVILSYLQMALSIIIGIIYTPVMIRTLGQSEYGLYNTAASVISMLSILSLGFGSGYLKYYAKYKSKKDTDAIYRLNGLFLTIFSIIGAIALIIGLFLSFNLDLVYDKGLTEQEYSIAKILMILLTVNLSLSFPFGVFNTILSANERFIFQKVLNMGKTVLAPLLTLPLLFAGEKSIAVVLVTVILSIVVDIMNAVYVLIKLKNKFYFSNFEKGLFSSIFVYTSFIMINTIVKQINWNIDKVLLGRYQGTAVVAVYAVASTLHTYYENFSTSVSNVFRTRVHMIVNTTPKDSSEQREKLTALFTKVGRLQFLILGLIATGLIFFGKHFIVRYWAGEGYIESYYVCLMLVLPASIALIQNVGIDIQRALDRHKFRSIAYLLMSVLNLILTIYLCKIYGAGGAAFGTALSVFVVDGIIMNIYYHKKCNIDIFIFWKNILSAAKGFIIPIAAGLLLPRILNYGYISQYLLAIVSYSLIYIVSIWFFSMNQDEKSIVRKFVIKIKRN